MNVGIVMTFAQTLKAWRAAHKISQGQASAKMGVSVRTYQDWEQSRRTPPEHTQSLLLAELVNPKVICHNKL